MHPGGMLSIQCLLARRNGPDDHRQVRADGNDQKR